MQFLANLKLPPITVKRDNDQFRIETSSTWPEAIFWETIILGTVNALYYWIIMDKEFNLVKAEIEGTKRLDEKIRILQDRPDIKIIEFGTRRRFDFGYRPKRL